MKRKIVIAGGTGFIGTYLHRYFETEGYAVKIIARSKGTISWQDEAGIIQALEGAELLINLAGKSVDCRYNEKNKKEILNSRTQSTRLLGEALLKCQRPPELWINSSTATIYRHAEDRPMTERTGEIGTGFSVDVAKQWEATFFDFKLPATRQVALRIAFVLGKNAGALPVLKRLVCTGFGGPQGSGRQMISWLHIDDLKDIILFMMSNRDMQGVYNCSAPHPVSNATFMRKLRQQTHMPWGIPLPEWMLETGAVFIRTETELILKSRWVLPERIQERGFQFSYPELDQALKDLIGS